MKLNCVSIIIKTNKGEIKLTHVLSLLYIRNNKLVGGVKMTKGREIAAKIIASDEAWDERKLGADENFVEVVDDETTQQILDSAGTQLISIRMQKSLIEDMKLLASLNGLGYQTLMKQILQRFVDCEKKQIFRELVSEKLGEKAPQLATDTACRSASKRKKAA